MINMFNIFKSNRDQNLEVRTLFVKKDKTGKNIITVEENKFKNTRVIKRNNKTLSGINITTLEPTSRLYIFPHLTELFTHTPRTILCLGGGACVYPIFALKKKPELMIKVLEIDRKVIDATKYFPVPKTKNFSLINIDATNWVQANSHKEKYDLIFLDVGIIISRKFKNNNTKFLQRNFVKHYAHLLNENGVLIANIMTTLTNGDQLYLSTKLLPLTKAFKHYLKFKETPEAKKNDLQDIVFLFSNQKPEIRSIKKRLTLIDSDLLSYPKKAYEWTLERII